MSQSRLFKEDLELDQLRAAEEQLMRREREFAETRSRIAREREEQESIMPPLEEITTREKLKQHEDMVTRGKIANVRRDQNRSLLMLLLLVAATCALVWWGLELMRAG